MMLLAFGVGCGPGAREVPPESIPTTYRVITGVSMGAIGSSALGLSRSERFDAVAPLGGPLDAAFFTHMLDQFVTGGFCTREQLEALVAVDGTQLNDPKVMDACARPATPMKWEHPNDFNHWHVTTSGGTFDRDSYIRMMSDLSLAFGNFFTENPASPFAPPGVDAEKARHVASDFCQAPIRVKGLRNAEYNPDGRYDAITFCDGQPTLYFCSTGEELVDFCSDPANVKRPLARAQEEAFAANYCATKGGVVKVEHSGATTYYWLTHAGRVDPCREATTPVGLMLAFDYNGNGRRDYGEPVLNNGQERFDDVGADGCADAQEDGRGGCTASGASGDPNHDDFDPAGNPLGTEHDFRWERGEPFRDFGLDGVPGTLDSGEGNGEFDQVPGRQKLVALDGRTNFLALGPAQRKRLHLLADGGIRDIFNLGLMAKYWFSAVIADRGVGAVGQYRDFTEIPGMADRSTGHYNPWNRAWASVPKDLLLLYGKEAPTPADLVAGEGDHVGTTGQAANRFQTIFNWVASQWPTLERPVAPPGSDVVNGQRVEWFESKVLKAKWEYAVALPPGYDDPANQGLRYPVTFMLHGYGMEPGGFMSSTVLTDAYVKDPTVRLRPVIYVFPNGRCCYVNPSTGARDCRNRDDLGTDLDRVPGFERECHSGSFYVNRAGYTPEDGTRYGDAFFELMDHIDATYRTQPATSVLTR